MIGLPRSLMILVTLLVAGTAPGVQAGSDDDKKKPKQEKPFVFTNDDLPPAEGAPPAANDADATAAPTTAPTAAVSIPSYGEVRDRSGHGEGWWRMRAAELDVKVLDAAIRSQELHVQKLRGKLTLSDPTLLQRWKDAAIYLTEVEAERDALPDELRDAGGLPGWLRRGEVEIPAEALPAPVPLAPSFGDGVTLTWTADRQARFHIVEFQCLDCCSGFDPCEVVSRDVSSPSAPFALEAGKSASWRVRSLDEFGFPGEWSGWETVEYTSP